MNQFTIDFSGMDDGSRVSVFNAEYPDGLVVEGSYVFLNGTGTTNLVDLVVAGDNRVVITQMDDCCFVNNLESAVVMIDGDLLGVPDCGAL